MIGALSREVVSICAGISQKFPSLDGRRIFPRLSTATPLPFLAHRGGGKSLNHYQTRVKTAFGE